MDALPEEADRHIQIPTSGPTSSTPATAASQLNRRPNGPVAGVDGSRRVADDDESAAMPGGRDG